MADHTSGSVVILNPVTTPTATTAGSALGGNAAFQQLVAGTLIIQPSTNPATVPFLGFVIAGGANPGPASAGTPKQLAVVTVDSVGAVA